MTSNSDHESRRNFLKSLGILLGCQYFGTDVFAAQDKPAAKTGTAKTVAGSAPAAKYKVSQWTGDDFTLGHKLRAGEFPELPEKAERKVDFVIVGGGIAGMTAAFYLKDHDTLVLEQYSDLGGHSRGSSYNGIAYSIGAAYIGPTDGIFGDLYSALSLENPVELPPERNQFNYQNEWFVGIKGEQPFYKELNRLIKQCEPVWDGLPEVPNLVQYSTGALGKLDSTPLLSSMTGYSKDFLSVLNSFLRSSFGGGLELLSTLAGYGLLQDLISTTHVFKGGNSAVGKALGNKMESAGANRCQKNAFVWKIEGKDEGGASVVYSLADGSTHRVDCKQVIVATPALVASRLLHHIPDMQKAQLFGFKYCSYLVANMLMKHKLFKGTYDCFVGTPYTFADITVAETPYMKTNTYKPEMGSVLTVYQPYANGIEGRAMFMMPDNRAEMASAVVKQMEKLVPGFLGAIDEVVMTRWGHALAIAGPGHYARLAKIQALQASNAYSLCHSSYYGWPAIECAITAGVESAARAKKLAANPGIIVQ